MNKHKLKFLQINRPAFLQHKLDSGRLRGAANNTLIIGECLLKPITPEYQEKMDLLASIKNDLSDKLTILWGTADKMDRIGKEYNEFGEEVTLTPDYERGANRRKTDGATKRGGEKTFLSAGYRVPGIVGGGAEVDSELKFPTEKVEKEVVVED